MTNENVTDVTDVTATDARQGFSKEERAAFEEILEGFGDTFALTSAIQIIEEERKMNLLKIAPALPTMAIPFGIYCVLSALTSVDLIDIIFIPTLVGKSIGLTGGEFIVGLGIIALGVEIAKSVSIKNISTADHAFSTVLLTLMVLLVFAVNGFQNASFLALVMLQALDVLAGVLVTLSVARRDFGFPGIGSD